MQSRDWAENPRWKNVRRHTPRKKWLHFAVQSCLRILSLSVVRLSYGNWLTAATKKGYVNSLSALTGGQAVQQAKAGIEGFTFLVGVAADANLAGTMYPDQSLYPAELSASCGIPHQ